MICPVCHKEEATDAHMEWERHKDLWRTKKYTKLVYTKTVDGIHHYQLFE